MPSSQLQTGPSIQSNVILTKPPPPNKPPPPPPPPPLPEKPALPQPPPPPPPRNFSQLQVQNSISNIQLRAGLSGSTGNCTNLLNNGSSMNSINSAGRCSHTQSIGATPSSLNHNNRGFIKNGDNCSSRSSVSSHSSLQYHLHMNSYNATNNLNGVVGYPNSCGHSSNFGCVCTNCISVQHNYGPSSSLSDNGSCNLGQDNQRNFIQVSNCCNQPHSNQLHNFINKCQNQSMNADSTLRINNANSSTTSNNSRPPQLFDNENSSLQSPSSNCHSEPRNHCTSIHPHHHHHFHNAQLSSSSTLSALQSIDPNNSFHRCNVQHSTNLPQPSVAPNISNDLSQRSMPINSCNHIHRVNGCAHYHPPSLCHHPAGIGQQPADTHTHGNCIHNHNNYQHHDCSTMMVAKACTPNLHHLLTNQEVMANRSSDASNNESVLSTAHTHNLSNSSTTTHTSNVAVKHQPQFHRPILSRGARSTSSQQYDHYGPSSAASTSSATASLSSYQTPAGFEDLIPLYPSSKIHQPLPPPPTKSRPASPTHILMNSTTNNNQTNGTHNTPIITTTFLGPLHSQQQSFNNPSLPPLPPKPISPNASSSSTQMTSLRTSPSLQNQPIVTRVTSQAGVQNPLPNSDVPPPLPPLNPGSRNNPLVNSLITKMQNDGPVNAIIPNLMNLDLNNGRNNVVLSEAERKTQTLAREIELELESQLKNIDSTITLGICPKCNNKVIPSQEACKAMNQIYHATCFVCCQCNRTLLGKTFYPVGDKVYCEQDFKVSLTSRYLKS